MASVQCLSYTSMTVWTRFSPTKFLISVGTRSSVRIGQTHHSHSEADLITHHFRLATGQEVSLCCWSTVRDLAHNQYRTSILDWKPLRSRNIRYAASSLCETHNHRHQHHRPNRLPLRLVKTLRSHNIGNPSKLTAFYVKSSELRTWQKNDIP